MRKWIFLDNNCSNDIESVIENKSELGYGDELYIYTTHYSQGSFYVCKKFIKDNHLIEISNFEGIEVDLPYKILYQTKTSNNAVRLNNDEWKYIFQKAEDTIQKYPFLLENVGNNKDNFKALNILFKGVAGTGKSRLIDEIIEKKLDLHRTSENVLRINIHSASSNADLMQGIAISTTDEGNVLYEEKQGLIFEHIRKACFAPNQVFVLILEEIQENSLNELIGDLIYLIEPTKRTWIDKIAKNSDFLQEGKVYDYQGLIEEYISEAKKYLENQQKAKVTKDKLENLVPEYIQIPYLVDNKTDYRKMIMPNNLYIFCTSNYRDDKKVIEDNLLRRFHVIEVYPNHNSCKSKEVGLFLKCLNNAILEVLKSDEIHEDRFLIGHANWLNIVEKQEEENSSDTGDRERSFFAALLKFFVEFKEIREVEFETVQKILEKLNTLCKKTEENWAYDLYFQVFNEINDEPSYKAWIDILQEKVYGNILSLSTLTEK